MEHVGDGAEGSEGELLGLVCSLCFFVLLCSFSYIFMVSDMIEFFLTRSLLSASNCNNLVFAIISSCFRRDISASCTVFVSSVGDFFLP